MNFDTVSIVFLIAMSTFIMYRTIHEYLRYEHPILKRVAWYVLLPTYVTMLISSIVTLLVPSHELIAIIQFIVTFVFIYTGLLYGLFITLLRRNSQKLNLN